MTAPMFAPARKAQLKARVALCGPTGSGKTWTGLEWCEVFAGTDGRIAVIDTEDSAAYYADRFSFDVAVFDPPYEPARLVKAIRAAEHAGYAALLIDSLSHFWEGEGGTLDIADAAAQRSGGGNSFTGWKVATPALRHLIDTITRSPLHVVATMRSKMEYVLEEDPQGKKVPKKIGMAPVMRAGVEYEFTVVGDLDLEHRLVISKSRCEQLADQVAQPRRAGDMARTFLGWLQTGVAPADRSAVDRWTDRMNAVADPAARRQVKQAFLAVFGVPERVAAEQAAGVDAWLDEHCGPSAPVEPDPEPVAVEPEDAVIVDPPADPVTLAQLKTLNIRLRAAGAESDDERHALCAAFCDRPIASTKELTAREAARVMDRCADIVDGRLTVAWLVDPTGAVTAVITPQEVTA